MKEMNPLNWVTLPNLYPKSGSNSLFFCTCDNFLNINYLLMMGLSDVFEYLDKDLSDCSRFPMEFTTQKY